MEGSNLVWRICIDVKSKMNDYIIVAKCDGKPRSFRMGTYGFAFYYVCYFDFTHENEHHSKFYSHSFKWYIMKKLYK